VKKLVGSFRGWRYPGSAQEHAGHVLMSMLGSGRTRKALLAGIKAGAEQVLDASLEREGNEPFSNWRASDRGGHSLRKDLLSSPHKEKNSMRKPRSVIRICTGSIGLAIGSFK